MKIFLTSISFTSLLFLNSSFMFLSDSIIGIGKQPQMTIDDQGILRIIYGNGDKIFCATSADNGITFPDIQLVGEIKDMHLGMSRGPQLATSKNYSMVTAIDKSGFIHSFQLHHASGKWSKEKMVNDLPGSAPEGLMNIGSDQMDNFYAVWLDIRNDHNNKIYFSKTTNQGVSWTKNTMVYQSPEKTVCECCKPSIVINRSNIFILFRNKINGSRDLYVTQSDLKENRFDQPIKLGFGTWKLNACPMDGGGIIVDEKNKVSTVWQRDGKIFFSKPNEEEKEIGTGRNCSISDPDHPIITWQEGRNLKLKELNNAKESIIGEGGFIKSIRSRNHEIVCTWEDDGKVLFRKIGI
jgi:hypothetical protein